MEVNNGTILHMSRETLKLFWRITWRYKWLLIWSEIGATIFILADAIAGPLLVSLVVDKLTSTDISKLTIHDFTPLLFAFAAIRIIYFLAGRLMMQTYIRLEPKGVRDLEVLSFKKLQEHSLAFFADNFGGALVAKVNRLTAAYQRTLETMLGDFGMLARQYIAILIILFFVNWQIAIIFSIWTVLFCASLVWLHRKKMRYSRQASASQSEVTARLADSISNTLTVRSFARSKEETSHFIKLSQRRHDLRLTSTRMSERIRMYKSAVIILLNMAVLYLSVQFALSGAISIGEVVLIQLYLSQLISQLWGFGRFMDRLEEALADASEMTGIIMQPHEVRDPEQPETSRIHKGEVGFNSVQFRYDDAPKKKILLKDFNLTIPAGQKVGLVGPSGSGKTTLTKLLLRFMDIQKGTITIDGQDISAITQEDLRRNIAYVPQEPLLFHRSIFENIAYGKPEASRDEVIKAAKLASADDFIRELSQGYDTMVGERGVKLSGGQRQRIALARAILKDAPIIILDEATSSLDSTSEKLITKALDTLMVGRTTIVVAHRLSTIRKMDRILVLKDGNVVEDGSHQELVKRKGLYAELWAHQSDNFIE